MKQTVLSCNADGVESSVAHMTFQAIKLKDIVKTK